MKSQLNTLFFTEDNSSNCSWKISECVNLLLKLEQLKSLFEKFSWVTFHLNFSGLTSWLLLLFNRFVFSTKKSDQFFKLGVVALNIFLNGNLKAEINLLDGFSFFAKISKEIVYLTFEVISDLFSYLIAISGQVWKSGKLMLELFWALLDAFQKCAKMQQRLRQNNAESRYLFTTTE